MRGRPPASVRDEHQQQPRRDWKQRRGTSASHQCHYRRTDHDYNETRCSQRREPQLDAEEPGENYADPREHFTYSDESQERARQHRHLFRHLRGREDQFCLRRTERGAPCG
jgi:hypothetical protein